MHESVAQGINVLHHACYCSSAECGFNKCRNMKCLLNHLNECKPKILGNCVVCKEMIALICQHGKQCENEICKIPYCKVIKENMDWIDMPCEDALPSAALIKQESRLYDGRFKSEKLSNFSSEPIFKKPRLSPTIVKKEFNHPPNVSIFTGKMMPTSDVSKNFSFIQEYSSLRKHFSDCNKPVESASSVCQPSTSGYQQFTSPVLSNVPRNDVFSLNQFQNLPQSFFVAKKSG